MSHQGSPIPRYASPKPKQHIKNQRHHFAKKDLSSKSHGFSRSHAWMWELDHKESWALKKWCFWNVVLEKTLESPLDCEEIKPVNPKGNQSWIFIGRTDCWSWSSNTLATWCEGLTHEKKPWCWERLKAGGEANRGWDGWMASPTWWTWVWTNSGSWQWTAKPGVLQSMGSQTVGHDWAAELNSPQLECARAGGWEEGPFSIVLFPRLALGSAAEVSPGDRLEMQILSPPQTYRLKLWVLSEPWWFMSKRTFQKHWPRWVVLHWGYTIGSPGECDEILLPGSLPPNWSFWCMLIHTVFKSHLAC